MFSRVAELAAGLLTRGGFLGRWRLMSIGGMERDAPDIGENAAAFGYPGREPVPLAGRRSEGGGGHS